MKVKILVFLSLPFFMIMGLPANGQAGTSARDMKIAQKLDCVSKNYKNDSTRGVDWNSICFTASAPKSGNGTVKLAALEDQDAASTKSLAVTMDDQGRVTVTSPAAAVEPAAPAEGEEEEKIDAPNSEAYLASMEKEDDSQEPYTDSMDAFPFSSEPEPQTVSGFVRNPYNQMELGVESYGYRYEEPNFAKLEGYWFGFFGAYTHRLHENDIIRSWQDVFNPNNSFNMFRVEGRFAYGNLDYESNGSGSHKDEPNYVYNIKGTLGYDLNFSPTLRVTPYAGVGYRYLLDDNGGKIYPYNGVNYFSYDRESYYVYIPIGLDVLNRLDHGWSIGYRFEYDALVDGTQKSHFEDADPNYNTIKNDQNSGYGLQAYIRVMKDYERFGLFVEPFVRYWDIEDSDISAVTYAGALDGYGLEPANTSTEWGVRLGASF